MMDLELARRYWGDSKQITTAENFDVNFMDACSVMHVLRVELDSLRTRLEAAERERDELKRGMEVLANKPLDVIEGDAHAAGQLKMREDIRITIAAAMHGYRNKCTATKALKRLFEAVSALPITERKEES